jgi:hypothetical protein
VTATALVLEKGALELVTSSLASFFSTASTTDETRAKLLLVFGRVDALRLARSRSEFESAVELLATPKFVFEILRVFSDPHVGELARAGLAHEIAGKSAPRNLSAAELVDDLVERAHLLVQFEVEAHGSIPSPDAVTTAKAVRSARRMGSAGDDLGAFFVAAIGLTMAAHGPDTWDDWMTGALWSAGRRALVDLAGACGVPWEKAIDSMTTGRDRRLTALPFDQDASDRAGKLLGLQ